jgi:Lysyl oxidase
MRRVLPATLLLAVIATASAFTQGAVAGPVAPPLRPNIVPLSTEQVQIRYVDQRKRLYLSFETENAGTGPLEMEPVREDCDGDGGSGDDRTALQNVYGDTDGSGEYTPESDEVVKTVTAGCFVYHQSHAHWHFDNYARYQLLSLDGDRLRSHAKVGFCMLDTTSVDPTLPGYPDSRQYLGCPDLALQGISVGWSDIYSVYTPGQFVSVEGLPAGAYCLVGTADPADRVLESDETDNVVRTRVSFGARRATVRPHPC